MTYHIEQIEQKRRLSSDDVITYPRSTDPEYPFTYLRKIFQHKIITLSFMEGNCRMEVLDILPNKNKTTVTLQGNQVDDGQYKEYVLFTNIRAVYTKPYGRMDVHYSFMYEDTYTSIKDIELII